MQPLILDDLVPLAEYIGRRSEFFAVHGRYLDRYRRVRIGPRLTLVFENRQTLLYRVQELLRVARLADPVRVQQELDWYNRLLPGRDALQAAMFIDMSGGSDWTEQVRFWEELTGECLRLVAGNVFTAARLATCRPEDRCAGAAHWITLTLSGEARAALADSLRPAFMAADYRTYKHRSPALSDLVRRSLVDDLELSDRDRAA